MDELTQLIYFFIVLVRGRFRDAFFERFEADVKTFQAACTRRGMSKKDAEAASRKSSRKIRRFVRSKKDMKDKLRDTFLEFSNLNVFTEDTPKRIKVAMDLIDLGYVCDPQFFYPYIDIGSDNKPDWLTTRSTSQLENYHRWLRRLLCRCVSTLVAHCVILECMMRWNLDKRRKLGQKIGLFYDMETKMKLFF